MFSNKDVDTAIEIVKNLHLPDEFGCDCDGYFYPDIIEDQLINNGFSDDDFDIEYGISKAVIIFKNLPFVIKIPFHGKWYDAWDSENEEYYNAFERFCCADSIYKDDYCEAEVNAIQTMVYFGFEDIVAYEICLGEFNNTTFYLQEKVKSSRTSNHYKPSENSMTRAREIGLDYEYCDVDWRACVIEIYGEEYWRSFVNWALDEHNYILNDLHSGNYGYNYEGKPVLFDVSGFEE